ncbi:hypothetical protein BA190_27575 [Labrys sp. WJW]|uniref:Mu-like prophage major head subunit gpT family protein n=1 Tax=Labrys sp. WJW TaxID=1737983 RepID=UPI00082C4847|nr:Mu-like prophage major head subunit gpT family protein [Labrys sp. WJW]OCC01725.1 hypothetical protein BA190_27575 [Labrys sp. WJW]
MIINSANLRTLYTGFSTAFQGGFTGVTPQYTQISQTVPSTTKSQEYGWLGEMPKIREWIGDRVVNNIQTHGYTIRNRKFESTIGVEVDDIEDDNLGMYGTMFTEFGRSAATFPDELVWPFLLDGWNGKGYDNVPFFSDQHPVIDKKGKTVLQSNDQGGNKTAWFLIDATRAIKPIIWQTRKPFDMVRMDAANDEVVFNTDKYRYGTKGRCNVGYGFWQLAYGSKQDLTPENYAAARAAMRSRTGDNGRPLGVKPTLLVVPPTLEGAARKIVASQLVNGGETNEWAGTATVLDTEWLAAA